MSQRTSNPIINYDNDQYGDDGDDEDDDDDNDDEDGFSLSLRTLKPISTRGG